MLFSLARQALFSLSPEVSHELTLEWLAAAHRLSLVSAFTPKPMEKPVKAFGLEFKNPVGLAAGLDKNGDCIDAFGALGFGSIEIGTVTPRPQPGNPKPRLFRLKNDKAIINRMGFNNKGVDYLVTKANAAKYDGVLGINIGKNIDTPVEDALSDYVHCLERVYDRADYITVNISSPNTPGLRALQHGEAFKQLLSGLKEAHGKLSSQRSVPLLVKIAPDNTDEEIQGMAQQLVEHEFDGIIATNTTASRDGLTDAQKGEAGGLSGKPLTHMADHALKVLCDAVGDSMPVVGVGGIMTPEDALRKRELGASLVQIYTGFIYEGPGLVSDICKRW